MTRSILPSLRGWQILRGMKNLKLVSLLALSLSSLAPARTVDVVLQATPDFVKHHTAALMLGVRYENDHIIGAGLFSEADLRAGVQRKALRLEDNLKVAQCTYEWVILDQVPGAPTKPNRLLLPKNFNGTGPQHCKVDNTGEILLSLAPYTVKNLEVSIPGDALANRKARFVMAKVTPQGKAPHQSLNLYSNGTKKVIQAVEVMLENDAPYKVEANWLLLDGKKETESKLTTDEYIEIR